MSSFGIMTLTRAPCELDKMSLFQDLKLKRRKVDSRCSSDGESIADTSTSSPDLISSTSPKMSEAVLNPPSPDSTPIQLHSFGPTLDKFSSRLADSGVFDGGGTASVIRSLPRSQSPLLKPPPAASPCLQPPRPHSSPGRPANISPVIMHNPAASTQMCLQAASSVPKSRGVIISHTTAVQHPLWLKQSRINGVKPELIGGMAGTTAALGSPISRPGAGATPIRQTPTVIMGEAGGVRTMIWSQPSPTSPTSPTHSATTSWASPTAVTNTEESAAQMLLNLGQDRLRPTPRTPPSHSSSSSSFPPTPLNMERLWAGDLRQLPVNQQTQALNLSSPNPIPVGFGEVKMLHHDGGGDGVEGEDEEQPMICMICEDKATGLHYGIITCEGCKGFFKRTVQNRRVYTCVADGNCEITKAQRNRCQYCRFKKCIEQGMVLQAVREDRMPGGRNSGAVYNLYKVKYKKHKKPTCKQLSKSTEKVTQQFKMEPASIPANLVNGTILKTALTNPSEVVRFRQRLDSAVSSSRDRNFSIEYSLSMIKTLLDCDNFQDVTTVRGIDELSDQNVDLNDKLCNIGDSIVYKLVQWTKRLPFYLELSLELHTFILTRKWHELLVLSTAAYQAIHKYGEPVPMIKSEMDEEVEHNLYTLQSRLLLMIGQEITIEQLRQDVGRMIEKITHITLMFRQLKLTMEEYVCLKVIIMLQQDIFIAARSANNSVCSELDTIHDRYMTCLRVYTQQMFPQQTTRMQDLLARLPEIQSAASLLLDSKMFYVPFLLNSSVIPNPR